MEHHSLGMDEEDILDNPSLLLLLDVDVEHHQQMKMASWEEHFALIEMMMVVAMEVEVVQIEQLSGYG